jgi:hypothetical protein
MATTNSYSDNFSSFDTTKWTVYDDAAYRSGAEDVRLTSNNSHKEGYMEYDPGAEGEIDVSWNIDTSDDGSGFHKFGFYADGPDPDDSQDGMFNNGYVVKCSFSNNKIKLSEVSGGSKNQLAETSETIDTYSDFRVVADPYNGTIDIEEGGATQISWSGSVDNSHTHLSWSGSHYSNSSTKSMDDVDLTETIRTPAAPSDTSLSISGDDSTVTWTDNASGEDGFHVDRYYDGSWSRVADLGVDTTSYSDTDLLDGEQYRYRVRAYNSYGTSDWDYSGYATTSLPAPSAVSATVQANDQIDVGWTDNSDNEDQFRVQISRDGTGFQDPSGGPTTLGSNTTGATYTPSSDQPYQSQVGIDSSFQFRVRAETEHANSSWSQTGTVYTDPVPPHAPYVDNRDGTQLNINWSNQSDIYDHVECQYRKDTGSGYGAWTNAFTDADTLHIVDVDKYSWFTTNARYQFRLRTVAPDGTTSDWAYVDYGNQGNVFADDFEDNDLTEWDAASLGDADSGVVNNQATTDTGISGSEQGSYHLRLDAEDYVQADLGDLSGESDVVVRCFMATGSMDHSDERSEIRWYDGSAWNDLEAHGWEYNRQGWVQVTAVVPDSWLSTDNRLRLTGDGNLGGGDHTVYDDVVVSDLLHEYTTPAAPSSLSVDASVEDELTQSWTNNYALPAARAVSDLRLDGSWVDSNVGDITSATYAGLLDGEEYNNRVWAAVDQYRRGSKSRTFQSARATQLATTVLPAPTGLSVDAVRGDQFDLSMQAHADHNDGYRFYRRPDGYYSQSPPDATINTCIKGPSVTPPDKYTLLSTIRGNQSDQTGENIYAIGFDGHSAIWVKVGDGDDLAGVLCENASGGNTGVNDETVSSLDGGVHTIAGLVDTVSDTLEVYFDGTKVAGGDTADDLITANNAIIDGAWRPSYGNFYGDILRSAIVPRLCTQSEIQAFGDGGMVANPLVHYEYADGSGSTAADSSPNNYDGAMNDATYSSWTGGGSWTRDGSVGQRYALDLDAGKKAASSSYPDFTNDLTVSMWIRPTIPSSGDRATFLETAYGAEFAFNLLSDGDVQVYHGDSGDEAHNYEQHTFPAGLSEGTKHHLMFTRDTTNNVETLYLDGSKVGDWTYSITPVSGTDDLLIGHGYTHPYPVVLDNIRFYNTVHGSSVATDLYNGEDVTSSMIMHYPMNDGRGATALSESVTGYDATLDESGVGWDAPLRPVDYTTTNLLDGEQYVLRGSVYTEHEEVFDN